VKEDREVLPIKNTAIAIVPHMEVDIITPYLTSTSDLCTQRDPQYRTAAALVIIEKGKLISRFKT